MSNLEYYYALLGGKRSYFYSFTFQADWMILSYLFNDGTDLDTRTGIYNVGQTTYLGYAGGYQFPNTGLSYTDSTFSSTFTNNVATHGGDNRGSVGRFETVLFNFTRYRQLYPDLQTIRIYSGAWWFVSIGVQPVVLGATLYRGGTPFKPNYNAGTQTNPEFTWTVQSPTAQFSLNSANVTITADNSVPGSSGPTWPAQRIAITTYNLVTGTGTVDAADPTPPPI
jgi:hypothetical protein